MKTRPKLIFAMLIFALVLAACASQAPTTQVAPVSVSVQSDTATPEDTATLAPSRTPAPTRTLQATRTLRPSSTPVPTQTPYATPTITPTRTPWPAGLPALRSLAQVRGFNIGTSIQAKYLTEDLYNRTLAREFNVITPEWEMLMCKIWTDPAAYDFGFTDQMVQYAFAHQMKIHAYALFSGNCVPNWMVGTTYSKEDATKLLHDYILAVAGRYRGLIWVWDVADETIGRDTVWESMLGKDYLKLMFQWAHQADPSALLFYNDSGIEVSNAKFQQMYKTVKELKDQGVPIDGVGMSYHINYPLPPEMMADAMKQINDLGLMVQVTQFDMPAQYISNPKAQEQQAQAYGETLQACLNAKNCTAFITWGFTDKHSALSDKFQNPNMDPLMLDKDYKPKPAYEALFKVLQNKK